MLFEGACPRFGRWQTFVLVPGIKRDLFVYGPVDADGQRARHVRGVFRRSPVTMQRAAVSSARLAGWSAEANRRLGAPSARGAVR